MLIRVRLPPLVRFGKFLSEYMHIKSFDFFLYISAWSYVNRVRKHFVISLNFACLMACLLSCLLMSVFFVRFVVRALCRCGCRQNFKNFYLPPPRPLHHHHHHHHHHYHHFYLHTAKTSGKNAISLPLFLKSVRA